MRLTVFTDFAFRVLIYLAVNPERRTTIRDIAERYGVSRNHLMKVVNHLTKANMVEAARGRKGGLTLARPASDITVGEVVRLAEEDFHLVECFRADNRCSITPGCGLPGILNEALSGFFDVLDGYSIEDLISNRKKLAGLLS